MITCKVVIAFDGDRNDGKAIFVPMNISNLFNGVVEHLRLLLFSADLICHSYSREPSHLLQQQHTIELLLTSCSALTRDALLDYKLSTVPQNR